MRSILQSIVSGVAPLLLVVSASRAATEELPEPVQAPIIRSWGTEAGLPQNTVNAITQTRDGYLWLGTDDGLARFDGVRFKVFGFKNGLPSVSITSLLEDQQGTLWIGTAGAGLCCLKQGRIEIIPGADDRPGSDTITCLQKDSTGRLWVGSRGGLRLYSNGKLALDPAVGNLRRAGISCLLRSRDGTTMWIATSASGLFAYQNGKLESCAGPAEHEKIPGEALFEDHQGRLWVGIGNGMVLCRENGQWRIFSESDGLPFAFITSMAETADGTVWAGSLDAGLYRFDGIRFNLVSRKDGLSADDIRSLDCDREGNLWIGTRTGGLDRLSRRKLIVVSNAQGLTNDFTHSVAQTPDGALWVGTTGGSLYRGKPSGFEPFRPEDRVYFYATVLSVLTAPDGSLWWGAGNGLLHWQNDRLADCITNEPWVQNVFVSALQNDQRGGMWIGTSAGHLVHLQNGHFTEFPQHFTRATITSLAVETNGALWVGTMVSGLKFIPAGGATALSITNGLPARSSICALYLDQDDTLWIGTAGGGLCCRRNGRITCFPPGQILPPQTVLQIVEDDHHFLWLGCRHGIFRVSKADLLERADGKASFIHSLSFGVNDGMLTEECSGGYCPAGLKTKSGLICISTVRGLVFLNPDEMHDKRPPPKVLLEEALVSGVEQRIENDDASGGGPQSGEPSEPRLVLAPGKRDIELHYTAIGFSAPEKIGFRYKLAPLDKDWTEAGSRRIFSYPRLPPGKFTFHVQACNADGVWSGQDTALAIAALPFFWEAHWFRTLISLVLLSLFAGILWLALRRRYRFRLARLQALNAIERERLRISKDMHDQVGSVLTQVSQLTDIGLTETDDVTMVKKRFERIGNSARLAVQSLDEIVWATDPRNDNLASFAEYISRFSDEFFEYTNIRCWQEMPTTLPATPLTADIRHNVFLAAREALNNALKHSKCAEVWLKMKIDHGEVTLRIEDNGSGFAPLRMAPGGNGMGNIRARLAECGGRVELDSAPGTGTRVSFIFPVKQ
jgi:ligand-binding sensor domain-containing protein/signal transduction histidine kinase